MVRFVLFVIEDNFSRGKGAYFQGDEGLFSGARGAYFQGEGCLFPGRVISEILMY